MKLDIVGDVMIFVFVTMFVGGLEGLLANLIPYMNGNIEVIGCIVFMAMFVITWFAALDFTINNIKDTLKTYSRK